MRDRRRPTATHEIDADPPSAPVSFSSGIEPPRARGLRRLLSSGAVPPERTCQWIVDVYAWLLTNVGGYSAFETTPLVLPTDEFFPLASGLRGDALAQALFERVLVHAGLDSEWKLRLAQLERDPSTPDLMGEGVAFGVGAPRTGPTSSIAFDDGLTTIHYAPHLLERVELFVAAMAYEVAHVLVLAPAEENALPGVDALDGPFLEVAATFIGFGVFTANSVFNLETFQGPQTQGWNVHSLGVLSEVEVSYALALFLALRGVGVRPAEEHLRPNPRSYVRSALKVIERDGKPTLTALRAIKGASTS